MVLLLLPLLPLPLLLLLLLLMMMTKLTLRLLARLVTIRSLPSMVHFTDQHPSDTLPTKQKHTHAGGPSKIIVRLSASV